MREVGFYRHDNADTWSAKTPKIEKDGSFYLYGNDIERGFDVYRFDGDAKTSKRDGRWMSPAQARRNELTLPDVKLPGLPKAGISRFQARQHAVLPAAASLGQLHLDVLADRLGQ